MMFPPHYQITERQKLGNEVLTCGQIISPLSILLNIGIQLYFIWFSIRVLRGTLLRLICIHQTDLKSLIAYSSVAHIGIVSNIHCVGFGEGSKHLSYQKWIVFDWNPLERWMSERKFLMSPFIRKFPNGSSAGRLLLF